MEEAGTIGDFFLLLISFLVTFWLTRDCRKRGGNHIHWGFAAYALSSFLILPFYLYFINRTANKPARSRLWFSVRYTFLFYACSAVIVWGIDSLAS